jgi:hypothetical protein
LSQNLNIYLQFGALYLKPMKKAHETYYSQDLAEQIESSEYVRYFTEAGYERLNALISTIKAGGESAQSTKEEFAEITQPWAEFIIRRYNNKKGLWLEADDILKEAIGQINTNEKLTDWNSFTTRFRQIMWKDGIDVRRRLSARLSKADTAEYLMAEIYRAARGDEMVHDDPAAGLEAKDLQEAIQETIRRFPPEDQQLIGLRARNAELTGSKVAPWSKGIAATLQQNRVTIRSKLNRLARKFFEAGKVNPTLKQWFEEHRITAEDFDDVKREDFDEVNKQKEIINGIFAFGDMSGENIARTLGVQHYIVSCLFRESMNFKDSGALSKKTEEKLTEYLAHNSKSEAEIAEFTQALQTLRDVMGIKTYSRRQTSAGAAR